MSLIKKLKEIFSPNEMVDYTKISLNKALILLAIPMILEMSLESVFAIVDMYFVGKLGSSAIAAVGLTEAALSIIYAFAMGLSIAATAVVARRVGEKNFKEASIDSANAVFISIVFSVILGVIGFIFAPEILQLMGASSDVIAEGTIFARILFSGTVSIVLLFLINGIFRGAGDANMAMRSLWLASIINIILCPIFIHFWGLMGAAIATLIGRTSGVIYQVYHLIKGNTILKYDFNDLKIQKDIIINYIKIAWPAGFQFLIGSGSWLLLARLVAEIGGTNATAGYQIAVRVFMFVLLPIWGLGNAAATLVGQNLGAHEPERARKSLIIALKYNLIFTSIVTMLFFIFGEHISGFFSSDKEVISLGQNFLYIFGITLIIFTSGMILSQGFNGAGDTKTPTIINFVCFWIIQLGLAYGLNAIGFGMIAINIAFIASNLAYLIVSYYYFHKGDYLKVVV